MNRTHEPENTYRTTVCVVVLAVQNIKHISIIANEVLVSKNIYIAPALYSIIQHSKPARCY